MGVVLRKVRNALLVAMTIVIGGGFASADTTAEHTVTYQILSFRAIALDDTTPVPFGYVRQGQVALQDGPILQYATTFASDRIMVSLDSDTEYGVVLSLSAGQPTAPPSSPAAAASDGGPACEGYIGSNVGTANTDVELSSSTPQILIDGIQDCGIGIPNYWITAPLFFKVDASAADGAGLINSLSQTKTVYYTIEPAA